MPFSYIIAAPDRVVFTRLKSGCGQSIFIIVGTVFTLIGIGLLIFATDAELPLSMMRFLFPLFGIIAIVVGVKLPKMQSKSTPDQLIFDNVNGRVQISQEYSDIKTAYIYYDEIEDFKLKIKSESSSSSTRSSRTYYSYHVYLQKKDGGQWELLRSGSEGAANKDMAALKQAINLKASPVRMLAYTAQSSKYDVRDYGHKVELSWKNPVGLTAFFLIAFSIVFISVFYTIMRTAFDVEDDFPVFFVLVGGFIAAVFLIVIVGNFIKVIKNSKTVYAVAITDSSLDYFEKDNTGRIKKDIRFPLSDIHAISFSFDTQSTLRKLFIYTHEQFKKKSDIDDNPKLSIGYLKSMYDFYKEIVALDMQELTSVEALHVENYLQEQIRQKGQTSVS
jgi:hypothetical protein